MIVAKLAAGHNDTVPAEVRCFLDLGKGDSVVSRIEDGRVTVRKAMPMNVEYLQSLENALCEWVPESNEEACRSL